MRLLSVGNEGSEYLSADTVGITAKAVFCVKILKSRLSGLVIEYLRTEYKQLIGIVLLVAILHAFLRGQESQSLIFLSYAVDKAIKHRRMRLHCILIELVFIKM